jgi:hypothetical protein
MTFAITLGFIVRSSSVLGWVPLALYKIFSHRDYFFEIIKAAVCVALPLMCVSIGIDSIHYGRLVCPQYMFVYVNVVEDITRYFGVEVTYYFFMHFVHQVTAYETLHFFLIFYFAFFTIHQMNGTLPR